MTRPPDLPGWLVEGIVGSLLTDAPVPLGVVDTDLRHVVVNHALASLYGQDPAGVVGATPEQVLGELGRQLSARCERVLATRSRMVGHVISGVPPVPAAASGMVHWEVDATPLDVSPGVIGAVMLTVADVTARTRAMRTLNEQRRSLAYQAGHDALTGLANRFRLRHVLEPELRAGRDIAVFVVDLDGFKHINDRHGHAAGDHVLSVVAQRLRDAVGVDGLVCRYGGDEFVVRTAAGAEAEMVEQLTALIAEPVRWQDQVLTIGGSIGSATATADDDVDSLLGRADSEMYLAKRAGR